MVILLLLSMQRSQWRSARVMRLLCGGRSYAAASSYVGYAVVSKSCPSCGSSHSTAHAPYGRFAVISDSSPLDYEVQCHLPFKSLPMQSRVTRRCESPLQSEVIQPLPCANSIDCQDHNCPRLLYPPETLLQLVNKPIPRRKYEYPRQAVDIVYNGGRVIISWDSTPPYYSNFHMRIGTTVDSLY